MADEWEGNEKQVKELEKRIESTRKAKEAMEFIAVLEEEAPDLDHFREQIVHMFVQKYGKQGKTKDQIANAGNPYSKKSRYDNFLKYRMPWGKHEGSTIESILQTDSKYLDWLAGACSDFTDKVKKFMRVYNGFDQKEF